MTKQNSAEIHRIHGNPSNLPNVDKRDVLPEPIVPPKPNWLSKRGKSTWDFLAPELEKNALLTRRDQVAFGMLCENAAVAEEMLLRIRDASNGYGGALETDSAHAGRLRRHPAWIIYSQANKMFMDGCKAFGLTPNDRIGLLLGGPIAPGRASDGDDEDESVFA